MRAAVHVKSARVQRLLYRLKVANAIESAKAQHPQSSRIYTLYVDYGQNMDLPHYAEEQSGCTYYYSPLGVYNLGIVDRAYDQNDGLFDVHLHAHVYHEGTAKKGANNVASLVIQMMKEKNWLREDKTEGELNIIFNNCSGQNKNNTMLRLMVMLGELKFFKKINFYFSNCWTHTECVRQDFQR